MSQKQPKFLSDKDSWMLAEDIPDSDVFFFQIPMSCFANDTSYKFLQNYKKVLTHYQKFHMYFYFGKQDSFQVGESVLKALLARPRFGADINANVVKWSYKLIDFAQTTACLPLANYSNKQLWQLYDQHDTIHTKLYTYGWLPVAVDMFHNNFTKKLKSYLYSVCQSKDEAEQAFVVLTTPSKKTIVAQEREEFLKIYDKFVSLQGSKGFNVPKKQSYAFRRHPELFVDIKKRRIFSMEGLPRRSDALAARNDKLFWQALSEHSKRWGHLGYIYAGNVKPFGPQHYLQEIMELQATKITPQKILSQEAAQLKVAKQKQQALIKQLKINKQYQQLFEVARDFAITKLVRRHAQLLDLYLMHTSLLTEIAKRLRLTRYQVQFMLTGDVKRALLYGKLNKNLLDSRLRECILYTEKNFEQIYIGRQMQKIKSQLKLEIDKNITEISGQTAQPGKAIGKVKIIIRAKDMHKMNQGDILVSIATDPDIVPAMKKAAAIVTEQGGITSHAAIVSRELGIPCVIGTKIATKILKDGDMVEVDANMGIVKKLNT